MTKDLWLVRHADTVAAQAGQKDSERELSAKGYQDATRLGHYLYTQQQDIDLMLVSTAQRAQRTAEILAEQMHYTDHKFKLTEDLYQASVRSALELINQQANSIHQLMIIGHNPTLTYLAEYLSGELVSTMAPGSLFSLRLTVNEWKEVSQGGVTVISYLEPDQLRG